MSYERIENDKETALTRVGRHIAKNAVRRALSGEDDFPLSWLSEVQPLEAANTTTRVALLALHEQDVHAECYVMQGDLGNGIQDLGRPRIRVIERHGNPTNALQQELPFSSARYAVLDTCENDVGNV